MIVILPAHFTLLPVELHITAAGGSIIRAKTVRARRLYCPMVAIKLSFSFPGVLIFLINLRSNSLASTVP